MPVVIGEIVSEVVLDVRRPDHDTIPSPPDPDDELIETIVRRAVERVLEVLRREWEG
jgi:hypothetical protein